MRSIPPRILLLLGVLLAASPLADGGRDSGGINFAPSIQSKSGDREIKLNRTGTAVRHRGRIRLYAIASYLQDGVQADSAEKLIAADAAKQLHLVMLRFIPAAAMADAFQASLRRNHPAPAFADEIRSVIDFFQKARLDRGVHIRLSHVPKTGLRCQRDGDEILIRNVAFSRAIWEIYLGRMSVEEGVKRGLISEL
jgi:hypothetical protein